MWKQSLWTYISVQETWSGAFEGTPPHQSKTEIFYISLHDNFCECLSCLHFKKRGTKSLTGLWHNSMFIEKMRIAYLTCLGYLDKCQTHCDYNQHGTPCNKHVYKVCNGKIFSLSGGAQWLQYQFYLSRKCFLSSYPKIFP